MNQLTFIKKQGKEILSFANAFAQLRISVFKEFPYLYEGSMEYELDYIQTCENALVFAVYDGEKMVGVTTCLPLKNETLNIQKPFIDNGYDVNSIFYFGESILLHPYRGQGLGHRFFDEREAFVQSFENYKMTAFCAVNRPENHPLKQNNYVPNDVFWTKRNYTKHPELTCEMSWLDIEQQEETIKELTFWIKTID
jgi:hypothetical protein